MPLTRNPWSVLLVTLLGLGCTRAEFVPIDGASDAAPSTDLDAGRSDGGTGESGSPPPDRADAGPPLPVIGHVWQSLSLTFVGPMASELDNDPNPFLDYRVNVTFVGPSAQRYLVPAFFDADGVGGDTGRLWRVRFTPDEAGSWSYRVSFEQGPGLAVVDPGTAGTPISAPAGPDSEAGAFGVAPPEPSAPGFLRRGRLEAQGAHYLRFRDGSYWLKGGVDSPENFLAYDGFDNTTRSRLHLHDYDYHVGHWNEDSPDWGDGRGRGIIGALNYLGWAHVNSVFMLLMNIGGDGQDVWPFAGAIDPAGAESNDNTHYDVGKLRQWEFVFDHAQRLGIVLHLVLGEAEAANKRELDDGELGTERRLYYREMIARFSHHNAIQWNLSEEYDLDFDLGVDRIRAFAAYLRATDPYDHPITVHNARALDPAFAGLLGDPNIALTSFQTHSTAIDGLAEEWRRRSAERGTPWVVSFDEFTVDVDQATPWTPVYVPDDYRRLKTWPIYLSGGQMEFILPDYLSTDQFVSYEQLWHETWYARRFLEENTAFWQMHPADHLLVGEARFSNGHAEGEMQGQVLAQDGVAYAIYLPSGSNSGTLDLSGADGTYRLRWYNPRTGSFEGETSLLTGGSPAPLGPTPSRGPEDWAALLERVP